MKKAISERKVQRMRNLVTKKFNNKTAIMQGYKKVNESYGEGDVWEERGKTWTIKNGIKQNIPKLQAVRDAVLMPICCPQCNNRMRKKLDKKFWKLRKKCFDCVVDDEHQIRINDEWGKYQEETKRANVDSFIKDLKIRVVEYLDNIENQHFITEAGDTETWSGGYSKEYLKESFDKQIKDFEEKWEKNGTTN